MSKKAAFKELNREDYLKLSNTQRLEYHRDKSKRVQTLREKDLRRESSRDGKRCKDDILRITNEIERNAKKYKLVELAAAKLIYFGLPPEVVIEQLKAILDDPVTSKYDKVRILGYFKDIHDADKQIKSRQLAASGSELAGRDKGVEILQDVHEEAMSEILDEQ